MTDQTDHSGEAVWAAAVALIAHRRLSVDGRCSCGHVVPLGYSFAEHQAEAAVAAARPAIEREAKAAAWDEGFDAGHQAARAVNPEWPEQPTNPYRAALATGTTTNPQEADQ